MKKNIKITSMVLILVLLSVFAFGCGGKNTAEKQIKDLGQINAKDLKTVTLTFYLPGEEKPDAKKVLKEVEKRAKDALNIKLDFKWYEIQNYFPEVKGKLDTGDGLDGFYYITPNSYWNFIDEVNSGKIKDLTTLLPKYAPKLYKQYTGEEIEGSKVNGKLVAVPRLYQAVNYDYVIVREDLMKKYNLPEIKTFNDYTKYMETIKSNEKVMIPGSSNVDSLNLFTRANDYIILDRYQRLVYKKNDPDMKILAWERTPEFKKFIDYFSSWRSKGYLENLKIDPTYNTPVYSDVYGELLTGKLASFIGNMGDAEQLNAELKGTSHSNWEFKGYLLYPDKKAQRESPINGAIAFSANSPNVERALMFLEWLNSDRDNYDLFMYGIKGVNYTLEGERLKLPSNSGNNSSYMGWGGSDAFQNKKFERLTTAFPEDLVKDYFELIKNNSEYPPHLGYSLNYTGVESESTARLEEYASDIDQPFIEGKLDDNALKQSLDYLKAVGTDKIILALQEQLDKWRKDHKK